MQQSSPPRMGPGGHVHGQEMACKSGHVDGASRLLARTRGSGRFRSRARGPQKPVRNDCGWEETVANPVEFAHGATRAHALQQQAQRAPLVVTSGTTCANIQKQAVLLPPLSSRAAAAIMEQHCAPAKHLRAKNKPGDAWPHQRQRSLAALHIASHLTSRHPRFLLLLCNTSKASLAVE